MKSKLALIIGVVVTFASLQGCHERKPDQKKFRQELKDREVMRVTPGQLNDFALKKGKLILDSLDKNLANVLTNSIKTGVYDTGHTICNEKLLPLLDTLEKKYGFSISRTNKNKLDPKSKAAEVYEAYIYNAENSIVSEDNLQKIDEHQLLYTRPIVLKDGLCLSCHTKLQNKKWDQTLFMRKKGDFIGMWEMMIPKKELIKKITLKDLTQ